MDKRRAGIAGAILIGLFGLFLVRLHFAEAAPTVCQIGSGCTGTTTAPRNGYLLIGGKNGEFEFVASSTLAGSLTSFSTTSAAFWLTQQTTSGLTEGSNLYYTPTRWATGLAGTTSDALREGSSNLYFLNSRAVSALTGQNVSMFSNNAGYITSAGAPVQSVFGRTGAVTAQSGDFSTTLITEGTQLYWTQARFDSALTATTALPKVTTLAGLSLPYARCRGEDCFLDDFELRRASAILRRRGKGFEDRKHRLR